MLEHYLPQWLLRSAGIPGTTSLRHLQRIVEESSRLQSKARALPDRDLKVWSCHLLEREHRTSTVDPTSLAILLAAVCEACRRTLGCEAYDVQVLGCCALVEGHAIEMDANWMGPFFDFLGIDVAWIGQHTSPSARQSFYRSQVLYSPVSEVGYDILRDGFVEDTSDLLDPVFDVAIVDEADAVMIDGGGSPLVLAGTAAEQPPDFSAATSLVNDLHDGEHFVVDADQATVTLTDEGLDVLERQLGGINLYDAEHTGTLTQINLSLHARMLVRRDIDYLVEDGKVRLINTARGRVSHRHRWPDGLHAAIEAKEGLEITPPGVVLDEFYHLRTARIEPHRPRIRHDDPV